MTNGALWPVPGIYCILIFAFYVGVWVFRCMGFLHDIPLSSILDREQIIGESFIMVSYVIVMSASAICIFPMRSEMFQCYLLL
jgi:hypothetical protein